MLLVDDIVVANAIYFPRGHANGHLRSNHFQHFGRQLAREAHAIELSFGFGLHGVHRGAFQFGRLLRRAQCNRL